MGLMQQIFRHARKPTGRLGTLFGKSMNNRHSKLHSWGLSHVSIDPESIILDVGCGGGKAVQEMARVSVNGKVYGVDYSEAMVQLSRKVNKNQIADGHVEIRHGSVSSLPFSDSMFNLVTAFETVYFWPSLIDDLREVKRVIKPGGILLIVNEAYKHDKFEKRNTTISKWVEMNLHTPEEYRELLNDAGYTDVEIHDLPEKNWITTIAKKR